MSSEFVLGFNEVSMESSGLDTSKSYTRYNDARAMTHGIDRNVFV